jgi:arginine-tRNA-protein transferase
VGEFKPKRDQRQACNRWNRFVLGDEYVKEAAVRYPTTKEEKRIKRNVEFDLREGIHAAEYGQLRLPPDPNHKFEVTLEPDTYTKEKFELFLNYQIHVHHETARKNTPSSFTNFLCGSPVDRQERTVNGVTQKLGSFHQMYRLDGRLIAMGVIDLLPDCVSGVYFIYHSDFEKYSFGKLSALREACLAQEGHYNYYYMGYYIHSCPKMRYKNDYAPQHVLDVHNMKWDPLDTKMMKLMEKHKFASLSKLEERSKSEAKPIEDLEAVNDGRSSQVNEAMYSHNHKSLFGLNFPGMMSLLELDEADIGLGSMYFKSDHAGEDAFMLVCREFFLHMNTNHYIVRRSNFESKRREEGSDVYFWQIDRIRCLYWARDSQRNVYIGVKLGSSVSILVIVDFQVSIRCVKITSKLMLFICLYF